MIRAIEESQQKAAKVAGVAYLLTFAVVVFAQYRIHGRLIADTAAETARNILAHETMFRTGIICGLLYSTGVIVLLTALYIVLKPIHRGLALLAVFWRVAYAMVWVEMTLKLADALRLLHNADYLQVFDVHQVQALAKLSLSERFDEYYVGLLFSALATAICGYLWFRSGYIPKPLAAFGVVSSLFCAACTFAFLFHPEFRYTVALWLFDTPMGLFDLATSFWLLLRGLKAGPAVTA